MNHHHTDLLWVHTVRRITVNLCIPNQSLKLLVIENYWISRIRLDELASTIFSHLAPSIMEVFREDPLSGLIFRQGFGFKFFEPPVIVVFSKEHRRADGQLGIAVLQRKENDGNFITVKNVGVTHAATIVKTAHVSTFIFIQLIETPDLPGFSLLLLVLLGFVQVHYHTFRSDHQGSNGCGKLQG